MTNRNKDRHQSKISFLESLQKEYFECEIKSKIYLKQSDRNYYKRVMEHKKSKILNLSFNMGGVVNIFDSDNEFELVKRSVYPENNLPKFDLTDVEIDYYYQVDSEIRVDLGSENRVGILISKNSKNNIALVKVRGEQEQRHISLNNIARIL